MTKTTIYFENNLQAALFKHELRGQISDGYWENSTPHNHWELPCRANVEVDADNPRVDIVGYNYFRRNYNFANKELVDIVGERMKNIVMLAKAGYTGSVIEAFDEVCVDRLFESTDEYWVKKSAQFVEAFGTPEKYESVLNTDRITTAELNKMLRRMSQIFNSGSMRNRFKLR